MYVPILYSYPPPVGSLLRLSSLSRYIDDHLPIRRYVKEEAVKETIKTLDRCQTMDVTLSQQSTYLLFAQGYIICVDTRYLQCAPWGELRDEILTVCTMGRA